MFQMEAIHDLLVTRKSVFDFLPRIIKLGLDADTLRNDIEFAFQVCANSPSFKLESTLPLASTLGELTSNDEGRFKLPFDRFSFVCKNSVGEADSKGKRVVVISRTEKAPFDSDSVMVVTFFKLDDKTPWIPMIPVRYGVIFTTKGAGFKKYLPLKPGLVEADFEKNADTAYAEGFYKETMNDILYYFLASLKVFATKSDVSYRAAKDTATTLHAAAKAKSSFWEYHVVKLGSKSCPVPWQGGHHAPPKEHERIGHDRTYKHPRYINVRGQTKYIESTTVGNIENGRIEKDYVAPDLCGAE